VVEEAASLKFLWFLIAIAWGIAGWTAYTAVRWSLARGWPALPCVISDSTVEKVPGDNPYVFRVRYRYTWAGAQYDGSTYREEYRGSPDIAPADRLARTFPIGSHQVCYVNPRHSPEAILEHENVWVPAVLAVALFLGGAFLIKTPVLTRPRGGSAPVLPPSSWSS
jgi:hypothetical protein